MLEIKNTSGLTLQLPAGQKLTIEINSTIFDTDDIIRGSYSYPFKFPLNENNRRFISHGHLPESPLEPDMQVNVRAGAHAFVATLTYKTQGKYADAALLIDLGELADKIRNVPVREFVTERFFFLGNDDHTRPSMGSLASSEPNTYPIVFPPFHNEDMVEADFKPTANYQRPIVTNFWYTGNPRPSSSGVHLGKGDRLLVPMVYVCWLITYICNKLGFAASGTLFTDPLLSRLIIFNTQTMPGMDTTTGGYTVEIGRHLGEYSISEFFKSLRSYIGLSIDINVTAKKAIFNTYKSLSQEPKYTDISSCVVPGTVGVEKSGITGFNIKTATDSADNYIRKIDALAVEANAEKNKDLRSKFTFSIGERGTDLDMQIGTLLMDFFKSTSDVSDTGPEWLLPAVKQSGNLADPFFSKSENYSPYQDPTDPNTIPPAKNPWSLRFLIYWGYQQDTAGNFYPYASAVSYDSKFKVFGGLSLQPGEPDDMWVRYQKRYYEFLAFSKKITVLTRLPLSKLSELSPSVPIGFKLDNQVLGRYLFGKMSYELPTSEGYVLSEVEVRQRKPVLLRTSQADPDIIVGYWVELRLENVTDMVGPAPFDPTATYQNNAVREVRGNVVIYVWNDGLYTSPAANSNVQVNYKISKLGLDTMEQQVVTVESNILTAFASRTVLEENYLLKQARYRNFMGPGGVERYWLLQREHTYSIFPGSGYRTR